MHRASVVPNPLPPPPPPPTPTPQTRELGLEHLDRILVRDPPRDRLPALRSSAENERVNINTLVEASAFAFPSTPTHKGRYPTYYPPAATMVKKRSSLQAILVPAFLQQSSPESQPPPPSASTSHRMRTASATAPSSPTSIFPPVAFPGASPFPTAPTDAPLQDRHTRKRSTTFSFLSPGPRASPPPAFLLDADPFANLTGAPSDALRRSTSVGGRAAHDAVPPVPPLPRSPLYDSPVGEGSSSSSFSVLSPSTSASATVLPLSPSKLLATAPLSPRASTGPVPLSPRAMARPAHQRPAFKSRPSLPSLDTLARMNVVLTKKVRKGRVGAGLPFEPWDDLPSDDDSTPPMTRRASPASSSGASSSASMSTTPTPTPGSAMMVTTPDASDSNYTSTSNITSTNLSNPSAGPSIIAPLPHPQPLLPSQIIALGSVAADVEMVVPNGTVRGYREYTHAQHQEGYYQEAYSQQESRAELLPIQRAATYPLASDTSIPTYTPTPILTPTPTFALAPAPILSEADEYQASPLALTAVEQHLQLRVSALEQRQQVRGVQTPPQVLDVEEEEQAGDVDVDVGGVDVATQVAEALRSHMEAEEQAAGDALVPDLNRDHDLEVDMDTDTDADYADVLESYHHASRAGSEEGHGDGEALSRDRNRNRNSALRASVVFEPRVLSSVEEGVVEEARAEGVVEMEAVEEEVETGTVRDETEGEKSIARTDANNALSPRPTSAALIDDTYAHPDEDAGTRSPELEAMSFAANPHPHPHPAFLSPAYTPFSGDPFALFSFAHQAHTHAHHGAFASTSADSVHSVLFSSPPSSASAASLSRSMSFRSCSSRASGSSDDASEGVQRDVYSVEAQEHEEEGEERRPAHVYAHTYAHTYRRRAKTSTSLSSLDLDFGFGGGPDLQLGPRLGLDAEEGAGPGNSTRSSSSHPSLSRTRSSSDDSDVLCSPAPGPLDGYGYTFAGAGPGPGYSQRQQEQQQAHWAPTQTPSPLVASPVLGLGLAAAGADSEEGFGFGFDKLVHDPAQRDEKLSEAHAPGTSRDMNADMKSTARTGTAGTNMAPDRGEGESGTGTGSRSSTRTSTTTTSSSGASAHLLPSSPDDYLHSQGFEQGIQMGTTITRMMGAAFGVGAAEMGAQVDVGSQENLEPEPEDAGGMPASRSGSRAQGYPPSSSSAASYAAGSSSSSYRTVYSSASHRTQRERGRGNSDDEDDDDERRRRRLPTGHRAEAPPPVTSEDDEDARAAQSKTQLASSPRSASRSRGTSSATSSSTSPMPAPARLRPSTATRFPASSPSSSRYVSADEDNDSAHSSSGSDDDVPLAQRIPGALTAQKTIRRQFREEREQRRRERALRVDTGGVDRRARQVTLRPAGAGLGMDSGAMRGSSSHDAAMVAQAAAAASVASWTPPPSQARQRTMTLPGSSASPGTPAFSPHDLARKLHHVQLADVESPTAHRQYYPQQQQQAQYSPAAVSSPHARSKSISRPSADYQRSAEASYPAQTQTQNQAQASSSSSPAVRTRSIKEPPRRQQPPPPPPTYSPSSPSYAPPVPTLRPMRSFHRPSTADRERERPSTADRDRMPTERERPADAVDYRTGRARAESAAPARATHDAGAPPRRALSVSRRAAAGERGPMGPSEPVPPLPPNLRPSIDDQNKHASNSNSKLYPTAPSSEARSATRTSTDAERPTRQPGHMATRSTGIAQQRVFVGNLQQFHMVEIGPGTAAGDVVALMEAQGALVGWAGAGGWMVFEVAQDFGMERPIRSFELLGDVQASWLKDKTVNYFMLKLTPLAVPLARNAIPSSSPVHSGYVEWEAKRGKWSKRWLQLREHSLWLSKRDNGKDEVLICSLSNFDAYHVTRAHRAPKPFGFALKSTDNLSFFENTADYLHHFSCAEKEGAVWMEKILVARSYVLHQERNVLFNPKPASNNTGAALSRAGTRKNSSAPQRSAQQPLVNLPPLYALAAQSIHNDVFEPGSLLSKQP